MRKTVFCYLALALAAMGSKATASPLYGTAKSFDKSVFCKKYECILIDSGPFDIQRSPGAIIYTYMLKVGARVQLGRDAKNILLSASIDFDGAAFAKAASIKGSEVATAFAKEITGQSFAISYVPNCVLQIKTEGLTICKPLQSGGYRIVGQGALTGRGFNGMPNQDSLTVSIFKSK